MTQSIAGKTVIEKCSLNIDKKSQEETGMFIVLAGIIGVAIIVAVVAAISTVVSTVGFIAAREEEEN